MLIKRRRRNNMPNKDRTGPRASSQGPRDGRGLGQGRGRADGSQEGVGAMKGGQTGYKDRK